MLKSPRAVYVINKTVHLLISYRDVKDMQDSYLNSVFAA